MGTMAQRDVGVNASLREATVDPDPTSRGNPNDFPDVKRRQAEEKREARAECCSRIPIIRVAGAEEIEDQHPHAPKTEAPLPPQGKVEEEDDQEKPKNMRQTTRTQERNQKQFR